MTSYILRRLGGLFVSLVVLSVVVFTLMHTVPGGPFSYDQNMPQYMMENIERKYVGSISRCVQYLNWVSAMLHGDFGIPFQSPTETVVEVVLRARLVTLTIGAVSSPSHSASACSSAPSQRKQNSCIDNLGDLRRDAAWRCSAVATGLVLVITGRGAVAVRLFGWGEPKHLIMPVTWRSPWGRWPSSPG